MTTNFNKILPAALVAAALFVPAHAGTIYHFRVAAAGVQAPPAIVSPNFENWLIAARTVGDVDFVLNNPLSNSDGEFAYSSSDPSIAAVEGNVVHVRRAGTVTLTADQSATREFLAGSISSTLQINKAGSALAAWAIDPVTVGTADFALVAPVSRSPGAFTFSSSDPSIATVTGARVQVLKAGTVTITAVQAATDDYLGGQVNAQLVVNPPAGPTLVGDGVSKAGACSTGQVGCATFNSVSGYQLDKVGISADNLSLSRREGSAPQVYFTKNPTSGKYYFELKVSKVHDTSYLYFGAKYTKIPSGTNRILVDYDAQTVTVAGSTTTTLKFTSNDGFVQVYDNITANFGQSPFSYAVPAGYHAGLY